MRYLYEVKGPKNPNTLGRWIVYARSPQEAEQKVTGVTGYKGNKARLLPWKDADVAQLHLDKEV